MIATFAVLTDATAAAFLLRDRLRLSFEACSMATVAAPGEAYDGHRLVAAWVADDCLVDARALVIGMGGMLHEPPATPALQPPRTVQDAISGPATTPC